MRGVRSLAVVCCAALCVRCLVGVGDVEHDQKASGGAGQDASSGGSANGGTGAGGTGAIGSGASGGSSDTGPNLGGSAGQIGSDGGTFGGSGGAAGETSVGGAGGSGGGVAGSCAVPPDNFDDGTIAASWTVFGLGVSETGGRLVLAPPTTLDAFAYGGVRTLSTYDLRECDLVIEVVDVLESENATSVYVVWVPESDPKQAVRIEWKTGSLYLGRDAAPFSIPYVAADARWWRIRSAGGTTEFSISGDGKYWTDVTTANTSPAFVSARIEMGAGTWNGKNVAIGDAKLDNFFQP